MTSDDQTPRVYLVVEDDAHLRNGLLRALARRGHTAHGAADGDEALAVAQRAPPDRATVDLRLPGTPGLEVVRKLLALHPALAIVVLTGYGSIATAVQALKLGAKHYLTKPVDVDDVLRAFGPAPQLAYDTAELAAPSLDRAEWEHISRVLADCSGNISKAARALRIERRTLQRKLAKYPVPR